MSHEIIYLRIIYGLIFPVILIGEAVITIYINTKNSELRRRVSTIFINNLAFCGGAIGAANGLFTLLRTICLSQGNMWCDTRLIPYFWALGYLHIVSVFCLVCVSFDRYLAICWPLRYRELLTSSRCLYMTIVSWLLPAMLMVLPTVALLVYQTLKSEDDISNHAEKYRSNGNSNSKIIMFHNPYHMRNNGLSSERLSKEDCQLNITKQDFKAFQAWFIRRNAFSISYATTYFISFFVILVLYILVAIEFCKFKERTHAMKSMQEEDTRTRKKTTLDFFLVVFLYMCLSMPHVIMKVSDEEWAKYGIHYTVFLAVIHQILFLPLYAWRFTEFRRELHALTICKAKTFLRCCGQAHNKQAAFRPKELRATPSASSSFSFV